MRRHIIRAISIKRNRCGCSPATAARTLSREASDACRSRASSLILAVNSEAALTPSGPNRAPADWIHIQCTDSSRYSRAKAEGQVCSAHNAHACRLSVLLRTHADNATTTATTPTTSTNISLRQMKKWPSAPRTTQTRMSGHGMRQWLPSVKQWKKKRKKKNTYIEKSSPLLLRQTPLHLQTTGEKPPRKLFHYFCFVFCCCEIFTVPSAATHLVPVAAPRKTELLTSAFVSHMFTFTKDAIANQPR